MKLKHALSVLAAVALGLAFAAPSMAQEPRPYAINVKADVAPIGKTDIAYPYLAARNGLSGECRLTVDISAGQAHDVRVVACSSELFASQARKAAQHLSFPRNVTAEDSPLTIQWFMDGLAKPLVTASR